VVSRPFDVLFRYKADTKGLEKGNKRAKRSMSAVSGAAKSLGGVLAVTFGAREILRFGQDSITAAISYEESLNAVEVATGSAAKAIFEIGETSAESLGIGKLAVNEAAVAFAGFAKQINKDDTAGTFEELLTRATDFASVFEITVPEALEIFQSTLAGQSKPIRRFGRDTSAASVKAFALANGIGDVTRELTEGEKVQARYGLLLQETADVAGDFGNTIESTANQQKISNEQMEDAKILLGEEMIPLQRQWTNIQRKLVIPALIGVADELGRTTDGFTAMGDGIAVAADSSLDFVDRLSGLKDTAEGLSDFLNFFLTPGLGQMRDAIDDAAVAAEEELIPVMSDLADTTVTYKDATVDAADATGDLAGKVEDLAPPMKTVQQLTAIFAGDLFAAAREARGLKRAAEGLGSLFAGGGGSGETGPPATRAPTGQLREFSAGGVVGGPRGKASLAVVHGGERVTTPGSSGGGNVTVNFNGVVTDPVGVAQEIQDLLDLNARVNGPGL